MSNAFFGNSRMILFDPSSGDGSTPPTSREVTRIWWSNDENDYSDCPSNDGIFDYSCFPDGKYNTDAVKIEFGSDVTSIAVGTFRDSSGLTSVTIPDSVTSIYMNAFKACSVLMSVTISDKVERIMLGAFEGCDNLTNVTIVANGGNAKNVKQMMIDAGVSSSITWNMPEPIVEPSPYFTYDSNRVIIGLHPGEPNVYEEGGWTYGGSDVVENYATAIGEDAFNDTGYIEYDIPPSKGITGNITFQNVTNIGDYAFQNCIGIVNVLMPNVTNIGQNAFYNCSGLTSITIGSEIQKIGGSAFATYGNPVTLTIGKSVAEVRAIGQSNYDRNTNVPYSEWGLPSGSTIVCTGGDTIPID